MKMKSLLALMIILAAHAPGGAQTGFNAGSRAGSFPRASASMNRELQTFLFTPNYGPLFQIRNFDPNSEDIQKAVGLMLPYLPDDIEHKLSIHNKGIDYAGEPLRRQLTYAQTQAAPEAEDMAWIEAKKVLSDMAAEDAASPEALAERAKALSIFGIYGGGAARPAEKLAELALRWKTERAGAKAIEISRALRGEMSGAAEAVVALESLTASRQESVARALAKALPPMKGRDEYEQIQRMLAMGRHGGEMAQMIIVNGLARQLYVRPGANDVRGGTIVEALGVIGRSSLYSSVAARVIRALGEAPYRYGTANPEKHTFIRIHTIGDIAIARRDIGLLRLAQSVLFRQPSDDFTSQRVREAAGRVSDSLAKLAGQEGRSVPSPSFARAGEARVAARMAFLAGRQAWSQRLGRAWGGVRNAASAISAIFPRRAVDWIPFTMMLLTVAGLVTSALALLGMVAGRAGAEVVAIGGMVVALASLILWIFTQIIIKSLYK